MLPDRDVLRIDVGQLGGEAAPALVVDERRHHRRLQRVGEVIEGVGRDERFADTSCRVATYTLDHLAYSLQPPVVAAFVDYEGGGRFSSELTDVDPKEVAIGKHLEMTFRRLYTAQGVDNY